MEQVNKIIEKKTDKIKKIFKTAKWQRCINPLSNFFGVKTKPYLSETEIVIATQLCINQFFQHKAESETANELGRFELYPNVKTIFNLFVLDKCTNIEFNGEYSDNLLESGLINYISKKVKNYDEVWKMIFESISLKNTFVGLNIIADMIPNPKDMDKNIKDMTTMIKDLNEKDPQAFRKMVEVAAVNQAYASGVDDFTQKMAEEKSKNLK